MKPFAYVNPTNEKDAVAALSPELEKAMPIGGGQDLLARMKDYVTQPDRIVNVKSALESTVTPLNGGLRIGAAMKMVDLAEHAEIARMYPAIAAAAIEVGTPQIRNQGTVGGNLNQRPRCWYFRNEEFVCFKKGGNTCFSPAGENQFHAILGGGPSFIVHPSSLAVPMVAYGATFRLAGPNGERLVPAADYFTLPTTERAMENVLAPNELLTHVILPAPGNVKSGHYEVRYKASHDWPIAFATVLLTMNGTDRAIGARRDGRGRADPVALAAGRAGARRQDDHRGDRGRRRRRRPEGRASAQPERVQGRRSRRPPSSAPSCAPPASRRRLTVVRAERRPTMESLTSPKITVGVHCLKLRTKGMYIQAVVDPDEATFYDTYDRPPYWCARRRPASGPTASPFARISAAAAAAVVSPERRA